MLVIYLLYSSTLKWAGTKLEPPIRTYIYRTLAPIHPTTTKILGAVSRNVTLMGLGEGSSLSKHREG